MTGRPVSPYAALARAHLRRPEERAVFAVVAGAPGRVWTSAQAAHAAHVDELETDQTLRRFAAAGIVEVVHSDRARHYRYAAGMDYLDVAKDAWLTSELRDPVCGMPVVADTPHTARDPDGPTVHFCSLTCLTRWHRRQRRRPRA